MHIISDQSQHLFQSLPAIGQCTSLIQFQQTAKYIVVASLSQSDQPIWHFSKTGIWKRDLSKKKDECTAEKEVIILEVKFESNRNGVVGGIADLALLSLPPFKTLCVHPWVPCGSTCINTEEEMVVTKKGEDAPQEVMYVKTSYDRNLRNTSQHRNHKGQKMLEADPHLVQCMTFHQDIVAKMAHSVSWLIWQKESKHCSDALDKVFTEKETTLMLQCF